MQITRASKLADCSHKLQVGPNHFIRLLLKMVWYLQCYAHRFFVLL